MTMIVLGISALGYLFSHPIFSMCGVVSFYFGMVLKYQNVLKLAGLWIVWECFFVWLAQVRGCIQVGQGISRN